MPVTPAPSPKVGSCNGCLSKRGRGQTWFCCYGSEGLLLVSQVTTDKEPLKVWRNKKMMMKFMRFLVFPWRSNESKDEISVMNP